MPLELKFTVRKLVVEGKDTLGTSSQLLTALVYWQFPRDQSRVIDSLTQPPRSSGHACRKGQ